MAWGGHALLHQPLDYFQSNQFWPLPDSLAFSDALAGYAPAGIFGSGVHAAVVRYDLLFLFAFALAFVGAHLLARELGAPPWAAAVAGAAFAYAPWRLEQDGHMHVISSGGIPLALFLLLRGYRTGRGGMVFAGWVVAAWQVSLGFTLGLQLGYLLALLAIGAAVVWWRRGRPALPPRLVRATAAGVIVLAVVTAWIAVPFVRVQRDHPESHRSVSDVAAFSGPVTMFAAASKHDAVWGGATASVRDALPFIPEQTLFPGLAVLALAIAGLGSPAYRRPVRIGLGVGVLAFALLSLGFRDDGWGWLFPYRWLYEVVPGWQGIRVPGRLNTLTSLGLALLAAAGAARLTRRGGGLAAVAGPLLVAVVLVEGGGFGYPHPRVPVEPAGERAAPAPQLHLPVAADDNRRYLLWSTDGFPDMVNGRSSFIPRQFLAVTARGDRLPRRGVGRAAAAPGRAQRGPAPRAPAGHALGGLALTPRGRPGAHPDGDPAARRVPAGGLTRGARRPPRRPAPARRRPRRRRRGPQAARCGRSCPRATSMPRTHRSPKVPDSTPGDQGPGAQRSDRERQVAADRQRPGGACGQPDGERHRGEHRRHRPPAVVAAQDADDRVLEVAGVDARDPLVLLAGCRSAGS